MVGGQGIGTSYTQGQRPVASGQWQASLHSWRRSSPNVGGASGGDRGGRRWLRTGEWRRPWREFRAVAAWRPLPRWVSSMPTMPDTGMAFRLFVPRGQGGEACPIPLSLPFGVLRALRGSELPALPRTSASSTHLPEDPFFRPSPHCVPSPNGLSSWERGAGSTKVSRCANSPADYKCSLFFSWLDAAAPPTWISSSNRGT